MNHAPALSSRTSERDAARRASYVSGHGAGFVDVIRLDAYGFYTLDFRNSIHPDAGIGHDSRAFGLVEFARKFFLTGGRLVKLAPLGYKVRWAVVRDTKPAPKPAPALFEIQYPIGSPTILRAGDVLETRLGYGSEPWSPPATPWVTESTLATESDARAAYNKTVGWFDRNRRIMTDRQYRITRDGVPVLSH